MFKKLISRLRPEEEGHPLASEKGLAGVLADIRPEEGEGAVLDVGHWLSDVEDLAAVFDGPTLRRAVIRLDEFVQPPLQATWSAWFNPSHPLHLSDKGWQTLVNHHASVARAYAALLADADLPKAEDKTLLPCFAARAMRAMVQGKKLQRLRYRAPDPAYWDKAGRLLGWARERGASQTQVVVYPGEEPSSVWREYLVGVYLELAPLDGMQQVQVEAADAILRKFSGALVVRAQPVGNESYCLDPASARGPFRRDPAQAYPPSIGYVGFDSLRSQIVRLVAELRAARDGRAPAWLAHTHVSAAQLRQLTHMLAMSWSSDAPQRRAERAATRGEMRAVFGFGMVRRMAACSSLARSGRRIDYDSYLDMMRRDRFGRVGSGEDGAPADAEPEIPADPLELLNRLEAGGQQQLYESWQLRDVSAGGIGVQLPHLLARHTIGRLVGYRALGEVDWQAGVIRRLRRDESARLLAGIEHLSGIPVCGQIRPLQKVENGPWAELKEIAGHGFIDAILLSGAQAEVLVPARTFSPDACFRLIVEGRSRNIRLTTLLAEGEDYERVAFADIATPGT
jgi:hypothetical protein